VLKAIGYEEAYCVAVAAAIVKNGGFCLQERACIRLTTISSGRSATNCDLVVSRRAGRT